MPYPFTPLISDAEGAEIREIAGGLLAFNQQFQDNNPITIKRGSTTVLTVTPITIRLDDVQVAQGGSPVATTKRTGTLKLWFEDVTAPIQQSDRFIWNDLPCIVSAAPEHRIDDLYLAYRFDVATVNS